MEKLSDRIAEYAGKFTGDAQEPDLFSMWADQVFDLEKRLENIERRTVAVGKYPGGLPGLIDKLNSEYMDKRIRIILED